jgi:hypothetical protein
MPGSDEGWLYMTTQGVEYDYRGMSDAVNAVSIAGDMAGQNAFYAFLGGPYGYIHKGCLVLLADGTA